MLRVYSNGADSVVAESVEDAWKVWEETTGEKRSDYEDEEWLDLPDKELLTIRYEHDTYNDLYTEKPAGAAVWWDDGVEFVKATCSAWARLTGRGWLCSSEW